MFYSPSDAAQRKRADSHSTNDYHQYPYVRERSRKSLPSSPASSHSLRRLASQHADTPDNTPGPILALSPQSSPVTSPSSAHGGSSRFADSRSSFTSDSASADLWSSRSGYEDGNRVPSTMSPPNFGTPPSPVPGRSRSITESDLRLSMHARKPVSRYPASSPRPRTAPHSPSPAITKENPDSHVPMGIKSLMSKPALPSPTRLSLHSPSISESLSRSRQHAMPRKSRAAEFDVSFPFPFFSPGYSHSDQAGVSLANQDSFQSTSSTPAYGKEQKQRNVLRRKPSAKAKEKEKIQRELEKKKDATASPSSSACEYVSVSQESPSAHSRDWSLLTPAGTVVQGYRQREHPLPVQPTEESAANEPVSPSPIPYYTVYGARSEHKIAAGGPDDTRQWSLHAHVLAGQRAQTRQEPSKNLARKGSLSRMVSGRWKKVTGGGGKADESRSPSHGLPKGRSSLQEGHSRRECIDAGEFGTELHQTRSVTEPRSNLKERPVESSKLWKLVKRISTGGMRERFVADKAAPPVPAIPKELLSSPPPRSHSLRAAPENPYSPSTPKNIANSGPRPSIATSSSSPNSSDVASARFFQRSHSRRSSVSSYGEEIVPQSSFPSMAYGDHHIVPPRELYQITRDQKNDQGSISRSRSRSHSGQAGKIDLDGQRPRVASPVNGPWETPPRTVPTCLVTQVSSPRTHKFDEKPPTVAHTQLLPDGNVSLSPPPRPIRSAMRSSRISQSESSYSHRRPATADEDRTLRTSLPSRVSGALSEASTTTMQPMSNSLAGTSKETLDVSHLRSGINFRALNAAPRRVPLTEREKAEIWDDLLQRSAQAGGTLHLGSSGQLESDNLRFSSCSEVSSKLIDL
ncbi:hypothetical protein K503DRAFT_153461 [Rhizopogon vinicolor AM-OR11-026]|uniref:Uncharacterized protein n=1 Tax=Rhizopogon vinicolor AM-OR11-026 TaxID=1314800 RepID=A0A1B7N104_9AGAM|nr:hypothetical protein K503DRAFT_153461 [Rhizopogon vinicolor AM-OR11-026]